ncbi:hypothetical protein ZWY2020_041935 [Hordeum vulgare]|nr:hypothetical protein ZWY2020_041935 [Hordeum vulgare]
MATSLVAAAETALEDLPEDALLAILAFLAPADAAAAACACRALFAAASSPALPLALALRLGLPPPRPSPDACPASVRRLFRSLHRLRRLLGLWRRLPSSHSGSPSLVAFEWAPRATLAASLLTPSKRGLAVSKSPFVTLSIAESGDTVAALGEVPVCVNFVGDNHIVVEAASGEDEEEGMEGGSPPEEIYMHFANRRSPGAGRRRRERQGRRKGGRMEPEHFVRIPDAEPTKARPLQGLWKGVCENRTLEFYIISYDDIGGVTCRRVSENRGQNSGYSPVFWTTDATFLEPPFSERELDRYSCLEHIGVVTCGHTETWNKAVSRILCINSSYDLVHPHLLAPFDDTRNVEGRIWLYEDGTFGFGFTGSNSIIDLNLVSMDGCIIDTPY